VTSVKSDHGVERTRENDPGLDLGLERGERAPAARWCDAAEPIIDHLREAESTARYRWIGSSRHRILAVPVPILPAILPAN
jgi:hypothetical protein